MSGAAKVNFNVHNLTDTVVNAVDGVDFIQGRSVRGPWGDPSQVFNSWPAFVRTYGGLDPSLETPKLIKRILEKGGSVRFNRVGHYTDIEDRETLTATTAELLTSKLITITGIESGDVLKIASEIGGDEIDSSEVTATSDPTDTFNAIVSAIENLSIGTAAITDTEEITFNPINNIVELVITQESGVGTVIITQVDSEVDLPFDISIKNPGKDGNNILVTISQGSNGQANSYNLSVSHRTDSSVIESYTNITIPSAAYVDPDFSDNTYLKEIVNNSIYIGVDYKELYGELPIVLENPTTLSYSGGSDGDEPDASDYIGSSNSNLGFYAFDDYNDSYYLTSFDIDDESVDIAGSSYTSMRQDLIYCIWLTGKTKDALITERAATNIDNKFVYFVGAGLLSKNQETNQVETINPLADTLAAANRSDEEFGPWYSFAGLNRGTITDVLGVDVNFGTPAKSKDLDDLANRGINMVVNKNNSVKLWGNFSGQLAYDQERFTSIVKLVIFIKKSLRPTLETFLEEPNDLATWKRIYYVVKPFLDSLVTRRALYSYQWLGDQDAKSMDNLVINNPTDVQNGKYKIRLNIKAINSIQDITVDIVLTPTGLDFELVTNLI